MEMRTHHPSKRPSMEEEDRLSSLPDDLLHSILRELPLKHAVRTSALSRRWAPLWLRALAASKVLDFTDRDFARGQPPARAAATVRRCLELHAEHGAPLDAFRVALMSPPAGSSDGAFGRDVVGWIASAVARGAREVEVVLTPPPKKGHESAAFVELPGDLFVARNSLARLALGGFSLRAVVPAAAPAAAGLAGLRSLSLSHVDLTGDAVRDVVSSCRALEHLSLNNSECWEAFEGASIRIASQTLRVLEIVRCERVIEVRVTAPALESIAFHDNEFSWENFDDDVFDFADDVFDFADDMPALRDVYLSRLSFAHDYNETNYEHLLGCIAHAPVWTLSSGSYLLSSRFDTTNIQELQLLMDPEDLEGVAGFLQENELPLLDRLFVRYPAGRVTDGCRSEGDYDELEIDKEFVLESLSFIKMVNFGGTEDELWLLAFVLKRAPALVQLVVVEGGAPGPGGDEQLEITQRLVSAMPKASPHARVTVCRSNQDRSQNPVHTRIYGEE